MEYVSRCDVALENGIKLNVHFIDIYIDCGGVAQRNMEGLDTDRLRWRLCTTHGCFEMVCELRYLMECELMLLHSYQ